MMMPSVNRILKKYSLLASPMGDQKHTTSKRFI